MRRTTSMIFLIFLMGVSGCATSGTSFTAKRLTHTKYNINGVGKISIARFNAYQQDEQPASTSLTKAVRKALARQHFFNVSDHLYEPPQSKKTSPSWIENWQEFGHETGTDAVLGGEIDLAEVHTHGQQKEAALVVALRLMDVATGTLRGGSRLVTRMPVDLQTPDGAIADRDLLDDLVERMAEHIANEVAPHGIEMKVQLVANKECREGLDLAKANQWAAAISAWRWVLVEHPENDAALYNIGAAHEFLQLYDISLEAYRLAHQTKKRSLYAKAVARIEKVIADERRNATPTN